MLAAGGVLEFVDEEMADVAGDVGDALGGVAEDVEGGEGELGEVDLIVFGEDDFELGDGLAERGEDVAEGGPLRWCVGGGREFADSAKCGVELGRVLEPLQEVLHGGLALLCFAAGGGKALAYVDGFAPFVVAGEEKIADGVPVLEGHGGREGFEAGEEGDGFIALGACVVRQLKKLADDGGLGAEEEVGFGESAAVLAMKGGLEVDAELVPVVFGHGSGEREGVLPLIADLEHFGEEGFAVGEAIVAEIEELSEGLIERGVGRAEVFEGAAGGESVEGGGIVDGLEVAAEARQERAVVGDAEAEGVDGFDGEALGLLEDFPSAAFGVGEGGARCGHAGELVGAEGKMFGGGFEIGEDAGAHFRSGGAGEGDGEDFFGLVDGGEEAEIAAGEEVGLAAAGGRLDDDGAADVEGGLARGGVGGGVDEEVSHRRCPHRRRRKWGRG